MPVGRQIIDGREYVYEYKNVWNKDKKRSEQKREYIGRIIDGEFVPNKKYLLRQAGNQQKEKSKSRFFAGATYLFDQVGEATGVAEDIRVSFPRFYKEILSLAYYLALEPNSPMYRFHRWARTHAHPLGKDLASQRISELLPLITEDAKASFFERQSKRRAETEYLFYDSTSISSYSEQLKQVKYGHNKDGDALGQINLAMLLGQESGLPVYYRKLPGNITDVMTIEHLLSDMTHLDLQKVCLVMDRGFYSEKNIKALFAQRHAFILGAKISLVRVQEQLDLVRPDFDHRKNYHSGTGLFMMTEKVNWVKTKSKGSPSSSSEQWVYMHMYYNEQMATDEKMRLNRMLDALEESTRSKKNQAKQKRLEKYFEQVDSPEKIRPNQLAIDKRRKNFGYFVLLSNDISDPVKALKIYRAKDMIEKAFSDLKSRLNLRRSSVSSEENLEGKLFIQFVALIYLLYVKRIMDSAGLFKNYTLQEMLDELDVIEKFEQPGRTAYYGEITKKQKKLYETFGFKPPT